MRADIIKNTCYLVLVLTLSCNLYHMGAASSKTTSASGSVTSPRKSFRPNMSACHTLSHSVRADSEASGCTKLRVSSNTGFRVFFFTFVFRLPVLDLSGNKYTWNLIRDISTMPIALDGEPRGSPMSSTGNLAADIIMMMRTSTTENKVFIGKTRKKCKETNA